MLIAYIYQDPVGVKALLDQLRSSQAWQEISIPTPEALSVETASSSNPTAEGSGSSVASLLSQLQSVTTWKTPTVVDVPTRQHIDLAKSEHISYEPQPLAEDAHNFLDLKSLSFQKALPYIAQLAEDPAFIAAILQVCAFFLFK